MPKLDSLEICHRSNVGNKLEITMFINWLYHVFCLQRLNNVCPYIVEWRMSMLLIYFANWRFFLLQVFCLVIVIFLHWHWNCKILDNTMMACIMA
jgi:hypothetical protein